MKTELIMAAASHAVTLGGIAKLMEASAAYPGMDCDDVLAMLGSLSRLIRLAADEAEEIYLLTRSAPESAATETSAKEINNQADNTTEEPKPSKRTQITPELKMEVISRIKKGESVTKVAADLGIGTSTAFRIKAEAM